MGEIDDGFVDEPIAAKPDEEQIEPDEAPVEPPSADGEAPSEDGSVDSVQEQLTLDATADEGTSEPIEAEPTVDEPASSDDSVEAPTAVETDEAPIAEAAPEADGEPAAGDSAEATGEPEPAADGAADDANAEVADDANAEPADEEDDIAAAIAASNEQVGTESTLDDIAPGTAHPVTAEEVPSETPVRYGAPWWPFLVYLGFWIAFAAIAVWQFEQLPADAVVYESQQYMVLLLAGLVLAAAGVLLTLAVWLGARLSPKRHRAGLFTSALIKGAVFILIGVVIWWGTLMALDYLRLGRII